MDNPGLRPRPTIFAVASPEQPEPPPHLILNLEVVTNGPDLGVPPSPFSEYPFRAVRADYPTPYASPCEVGRGIVGQQGHGLDGLGPLQQACGTRPIRRPVQNRRDSKGRRLADG